MRDFPRVGEDDGNKQVRNAGETGVSKLLQHTNELTDRLANKE